MRWLALVLWLPSAAVASECVVAYTPERIPLQASLVRDALAVDDFDLAVRTASFLERGLGCLDVVVSEAQVREAALAIAAALTAGRQQEAAARWSALAASIDDGPPGYGLLEPGWGRVVQTLAPPVRSDDGVLGVGSFTLNGAPISEPELRPGQWHLLQRVALDGVVSSWLFTDRYPADALLPEDELARAERLARAEARRDQRDDGGTGVYIDDQGEVVVRREFPKHRAPLIAVGATALATGIGLMIAHAVEARSFNRWEDPDDREAIEQRARAVNTLLIAGASVAVVGAAGTSWGLAVRGRSVGVSVTIPLGPGANWRARTAE